LAQQTNGNRTENPQDRVLQSLSGLTGTTITLSTKSSQRYEGVVSSTNSEGDTTGVTLKDVKELTNPGAPLKEQLFIASTNIDNWSSGPADAKFTNGDTFRTDTDISQATVVTGERELQAWQAPPDAPAISESSQFARGDEVTFGPGASGNPSWDQFAVNEKLFGVKATYDENAYTTKLDRSAPEYKERAREAQKIADEILGSTSSNSHVAEERGQVDDSGINEEDKYGAVVRGTNAYVPPGARKAGAAPVNNGAKADVPKVAVNGPDGASVPSQAQSPASSSKAPSPASNANPNKPPADALPALREFVANEKQRLTEKRQALAKSEMDKRMADLVKFSQSFKLNKPIPDDLVSILAKDEEKQKQIREKSNKDAASAQARNIGAAITTHAVPARGPHITSGKVIEAGKPITPASGANKATAQPAGASATTQKPAAANTKTEAAGKPAKPMMFIQAIPPFKGNKRQSLQPTSTTNNKPSNGSSPTNTPAAPSPVPAKGPSSNNVTNVPATAAARLSVNPSPFKPNPKAPTFTPGAPSPGPSNSTHSITSSVSPKPKEPQGPTTPNPFFGTRPIKRGPAVTVKDDFNPFKHNKVVDASGVAALWPYSGKRYMQMFPAPQHPPQPPHMVAPPPTMPPPPPYEEDPNQRAATGGYVYYAPYYPGQPMMPGMPPPGPPGTFMPPYMQAMHYPPGMPPNAIYAPPGMGQMPSYMQAPPGPYPPPPPNGAGPRPSMPPTPIPAHAHPYYHQSPQLQPAVPYPMMMPPPGGVPHPYDGSAAPPVQMGGHA
jgi:hypothetical protein